MLKHFIQLLSKSDYRKFLLDSLVKGSVGCELGVWKGEFSNHILEVVKPSKLYLVDPWLYQPEFTNSWYGGTVAKNQNDMDEIFYEVSQKFADKREVEIVRSKTECLGNSIIDSSLDWVYIDGNHEYKYVLNDLEVFVDKVKPGGVICGDDYGRGRSGIGPVAQAVKEFVYSRNDCELIWVKKKQFFIKISI